MNTQQNSVKYKMNKKFKFGFTIYEIIISIAILSLIVFVVSQIFGRINSNSKGKILAEQTKHHSEMFIQYLRDLHESNIYIMTGDGDQCKVFNPFEDTKVWTFSDEDLKESNFGILYSDEEDPKDGKIHCHRSGHSYWNDIYSGTNSYHQQACLSISIDDSGFYDSVLYWVDTKKSGIIPQPILRAAAISVGAAAGYLNSSGNSIVGLGGWSIPINSGMFSNHGSCAGTISKNSLFINLDEYLKINQALGASSKTGGSTNYLARFEDVENNKEDQENQNLLKTNIVLNKNNIIFNIANNLGLGITKFSANKQNDIQVLNGGSLQADWFMPVKRVFRHTDCESDDLGTILSDKGGSSEDYISDADNLTFLVCSHDEILCKNSSGYCYLPYMKQLVNYVFSSEGRKEFTCPGNQYVEVSHPPLVVKANPYDLGSSRILPKSQELFVCHNSSGSAQGGDRACVPGDPTPVKFKYSDPVTYKDPNSLVTYTVYKTVTPYSEARLSVPWSDRVNWYTYCNCDNVAISAVVKEGTKVLFPYYLKEVTCATLPTLTTSGK